uniref:Uncharacterized protein n=1 Tax=Rhizophora mucronata TaxID=61149 RepID=A0A2P2J137_RHIMU
MKNASRNKFLLCFKPVVDMDQLVLEPKGDIVRSKNQALECASMDRKEIFRRSMSNSSLSDFSTTNSGLILQSAKKNISQVIIEAVWFQKNPASCF